MSTTLKDWLKQTIAELEEERDATPGAVNEDAAMALAAMNLALASLEAEPAAYTFKHPAGRLFWSLTDESNKGQSDVMPVYTAQPAPVSVPDEIRLLQSEVTIWKDRWELLRELFREVADALGCDVKDNQAMLDKIEMLQGAEPVTTAYKLPMQPLVIDAHGTLRFKENLIVRKLLDYATEHGYGLNEMAREEFDAEDQMQLAQLIGYSLSGYGTLSYVTDESYECAAATAPQQEVK